MSVSSPGFARKAWNTLLVILGDASAVSEAESDRSGAFSWAGETHSAAVGFSLGFLVGADRGRQLLGALGVMLLWGNRGDSALDPGLGRQVRKELPYAAVGAIVGYAVGRHWFGGSILLSRPGSDGVVDIFPSGSGVIVFGLGSSEAMSKQRAVATLSFDQSVRRTHQSVELSGESTAISTGGRLALNNPSHFLRDEFMLVPSIFL